MPVDDRKFWNEFYHENFIDRPSPFAEFCQENYLSEPKHLVEFGSGSGRDLIYFHRKGHRITGYDTSEEAVSHVLRDWPDIDYRSGDFTALPPCEGIEAIYSRWTIHSINAECEKRALQWAADALKKGGIFLIEVRTVNDHLFGVGENIGHNEWKTDHYRRFVVPEELIGSLEALGFDIQFQLESKGLSVYKDDDPVLLRIVAAKKD